jgi:hypothetical protein
MAEPLAVRIRHRLRWVEAHHDRKLYVEMLQLLEGPGGVPQIPHPDGSSPTAGSSLAGWSPEAVITWLADRDVKLVPWQIQRLNRL